MSRTCPKCGSDNITYQTFQENRGGKTITRTKGKYYDRSDRGHGCLWWLFIGWWWWMVDLLMWITLFFPRLVIRLFRRSDGVMKSKSVSHTKNKIAYRKMAQCQDCGRTWKC